MGLSGAEFGDTNREKCTISIFPFPPISADILYLQAKSISIFQFTTKAERII